VKRAILFRLGWRRLLTGVPLCSGFNSPRHRVTTSRLHLSPTCHHPLFQSAEQTRMILLVYFRGTWHISFEADRCPLLRSSWFWLDCNLQMQLLSHFDLQSSIVVEDSHFLGTGNPSLPLWYTDIDPLVVVSIGSGSDLVIWLILVSDLFSGIIISFWFSHSLSILAIFYWSLFVVVSTNFSRPRFAPTSPSPLACTCICLSVFALFSLVSPIQSA
jgi:hypothetical protein